MTEFVFSMNYFFWLLAFKDGSFSDEVKLGAGLLSLPTSSESWKWMPWEGEFSSHSDHSYHAMLLFPFKTNHMMAACGGWLRLWGKYRNGYLRDLTSNSNFAIY